MAAGPEAWLLAVAAVAAAAVPPPPPELLEFLGDWSPQEQRLIAPAAPPPQAQKAQDTKDASDGHARRDRDEPAQR